MNYKLIYYPLKPFEIKEGLNFISIEPKNILFNFITGLQVDDDSLTVVKNETIINKKQDILFIGDVTNDFDLNHVYSKIAEKRMMGLMSETDIKEIITLNSKMESFLNQFIINNNLPLISEKHFDLDRILKNQNFKIEEKVMNTAYDKIQNVIDIASEFNDERLLVFTNACKYLAKEQVDYLSNNIKLQEITVVFIEASTKKMTAESATSSHFIDNDFIEF